MSRTKAGSPHDPRGSERFNEERAAYTVAGAQPDLESGVDAIRRSQPHHGTWLGRAVQEVSRHRHDRIIVITDEQSHDAVGEPKVDRAYMINVASSERAVGHGAWTRISGFSENVLSWIHESERMK